MLVRAIFAGLLLSVVAGCEYKTDSVDDLQTPESTQETAPTNEPAPKNEPKEPTAQEIQCQKDWNESVAISREGDTLLMMQNTTTTDSDGKVTVKPQEKIRTTTTFVSDKNMGYRIESSIKPERFERVYRYQWVQSCVAGLESKNITSTTGTETIAVPAGTFDTAWSMAVLKDEDMVVTVKIWTRIADSGRQVKVKQWQKIDLVKEKASVEVTLELIEANL